jgi:hypothetical protein
MRILKVLFVGVAGAALVTWAFVAFIVKDHVVRIEQTDGLLHYSVDDGAVFTNADACVTHCLGRRAWNLRNTVRISAGASVSTNDIQCFADLMCHKHIYPTTLEWQTGSGKIIRQYRSGPYIEEFSRQKQENANHASDGIRQPADGSPKPSV